MQKNNGAPTLSPIFTQVRLSIILAAFAFLALSSAANAARIMTPDGHYVVIRKGPAPLKARPVASRAPSIASVITVNAGADVDAANNDYRRIQNAIDAAAAGDTVMLSGTFDFTQPFAAAAWALGDDNTAGTADDYAVYVPGGKNNVTITAASLGSATIQGPGDLAAVNLEAFLVVDGGTNQNWTVSNLRILDFDLSIAFFGEPSSTNTSFSGTTISNNFIRIPTDLNATVAPADVSQNIGIYYSFGANQTISGNSIQIAGDGVSDSGVSHFSTNIATQCDTGTNTSYDGLSIANNIIHVLNAQSANPAKVFGIWENGNAHGSNISVTNNQFINDAAGNDPALNIQEAFILTSHSSATTTTTWDSNQATGAHVGLMWLGSGDDFTGNDAVVVTHNVITNSGTGVLIQSNGIGHFEDNVITGSGAGGGIHLITGTLTGSGSNSDSIFQNFVSGGSSDGIVIDPTGGAIAPIADNDLSGNGGFGLDNQTATSIDAENNWWGNNLAAPVAAEVSGLADSDNWLASGTDVDVAVGFQPFIYATTSGTITTFVGTTGADTGALLAGSPITMIMDGETATTPLAEVLNFAINLDAGDDTFTLGQTGIPTTLDGGTGNDTLAGTNVTQSWNITGAGSGNIPGAATSFTGIESLHGGTAADTFTFGAAGSISGTLDGDLGIDTLDNSAIAGHSVTPSGPGTLDGFMGTASGIGASFNNINIIAGSPADLSITKTGSATATAGGTVTYTITVTNSGANPALGVSMTDTLPGTTTFASETQTSGPAFSCTHPSPGSGGTLTCTITTLAAGATATFTLLVNVPSGSPGGQLSNTANVTSANDPNGTNNSSTAATTIAALALASVPATGDWALLGLAVMLGFVALVRFRN